KYADAIPLAERYVAEGMVSTTENTPSPFRLWLTFTTSRAATPRLSRCTSAAWPSPRRRWGPITLTLATRSLFLASCIGRKAASRKPRAHPGHHCAARVLSGSDDNTTQAVGCGEWRAPAPQGSRISGLGAKPPRRRGHDCAHPASSVPFSCDCGPF